MVAISGCAAREVFQPIGFDSFGIHTENYALRIGEHPRTLTERTIVNYRRQLASLGAAWDWSREIATSDPSYYRWTQWIFLQLYRAGLAVRREAAVVWCPSCLTVLANEQLEGERCERCGTRVVERIMDQWFLRITAYAEELLEGLDDLDWPESAKRAQREWIGRSEGVEIDFDVPDTGVRLRTFTTRPDTLFGVTFLVLPPEHPDLEALARGTGSETEVRQYVEEALRDRVAVPARSWSGGLSAAARRVHRVIRHPSRHRGPRSDLRRRLRRRDLRHRRRDGRAGPRRARLPVRRGQRPPGRRGDPATASTRERRWMGPGPVRAR